MPRSRNLGSTRLPLRRRKEDPMAAYDRLPPELRAWLREAKLPWSANSCRTIWVKARKAGLSPEEALSRLDRVEQKTLERSGSAL